MAEYDILQPSHSANQMCMFILHYASYCEHTELHRIGRRDVLDMARPKTSYATSSISSIYLILSL